MEATTLASTVLAFGAATDKRGTRVAFLFFMRTLLFIALAFSGVHAHADPLAPEVRGPFLVAAQRLFAEGDYNASRDVAEQLLLHFPGDAEVEALLAKDRAQLHRLAKESYDYGILLESLNRVPEAMQYWMRGATYVRPGDHYQALVQERLDHYNGLPTRAAASEHP